MNPYIKKIMKIQHDGLLPPGTVARTEIRHDEWCGFFAGNTCDCNPDVILRPMMAPGSQERKHGQ